MQNITIFDYLLLPVYLYIFYIIVKKISVKYTDAEIRKYFFASFWLHMFGAVAYGMLVQYYYGYGDSFIYYYGNNFLGTQVLKDVNNIAYFFKPADEVMQFYNFEVGNINYAGYFGIPSNLFVMKVAAILSVFAFNKYLIISIFFGAFSFAGLWRLFLVFTDINNNKQLKLMGWAILYLPSVWFWGSGLLKDSLCIGGIGFIVHFMYRVFIKKEFSLKSIAALVFMVYLVYSIKSYIIIIFSVSLAVLVFYKFITPFKNLVIRSFILLIFFVLMLIGAFVSNLSEQLQQLAEESKVQVDTYQKNYDAAQSMEETSKGNVKGDEIDASVSGLLLHSPVAVFKSLYRPFLWESRSVFILLSALESLLLLICTIFVLVKLRPGGFFREIFSNPYLLISFSISLLFALIIGFTTYNFGTIARYRIILLPFYFFTLVSLYSVYINKEKKGLPLQIS